VVLNGKTQADRWTDRGGAALSEITRVKRKHASKNRNPSSVRRILFRYSSAVISERNRR
jgi:hypothetical protein